METSKIIFEDGWYSQEKEESGFYRWMGKEAVCLIKDYKSSGKKYLRITAGHSFTEENYPILKVFVNDQEIGEALIESAFCSYNFTFDCAGNVKIELQLNRISRVPGDPRDLGIMIRHIEVLLPSEIEVFLEGWYLEETTSSGTISRWMKKEGSCLFSNVSEKGEKYLKITGGHPYFNTKNPMLAVSIDGKKIGEREIFPGEWSYYLPLEVSTKNFQVDFKLSKIFDPELAEDDRKLGIMVKNVEILSPSEVEVFMEGWSPEEMTSFGKAFRWMRKEGSCFFSDVSEKGDKFLKIIGGHPFFDAENPMLSIFIDGKKIGEREIFQGEWSYYLPLEVSTKNFQVDFKLSKIFDPELAEDDRKLGIMVKNVEILSPSEVEVFMEGWSPEEMTSSGKASRWMRKEGSCFFPDVSEKGDKFLKIIGGHPFFDAENPVLTISIGREKIKEIEIFPGERNYLIPLGDSSSQALKIDFKLNNIFDRLLAGDDRKLGIQVRSIEIFSPEEDELAYGDGWYEWEYDEFFPFHWMSEEARVVLSNKYLKTFKYISFYIFSEYVDFSQKLRISLDGTVIEELPLLQKWNYYSFDISALLLPSGDSEKKRKKNNGANLRGKKRSHEIVFVLNKVFPEKYHQEDRRELGIRCSQMEFHNDDEAHEVFLSFHKNAKQNYKEMREGKIKLRSYPLNLGVDLYGKCNIKPPCVYCLWHSMKELEGEYVLTTVDEKTLASYGSFFHSARTLVNCSFGEPLLHPRFQEILDFCDKHKKILEISTNGQSFNKRTIEALVGKSIFLYISLDAASKETYAKIRNDRWDTIVPNLLRLGRDRKKRGNLPKIYMVFMPMRVNKGDLEDYFRLCAKIEADALVLRPLLYLWNPEIEINRGGYHFDYNNELLKREELEKIFRKCDEFSRKYNMPVANQFNFGMIQDPGAKRGSRPEPESPRF